MANKIIIRLDASGVGSSQCLLRLYWKVIKGYITAKLPNDIVYGSAFHVFKETLTKTADETKSIRAALQLFQNADVWIKPKKEYLDAKHLLMTCMRYIKVFGLRRENDNFETIDVSGTPLVEQKFSIPYYTDDEVEVLLMGTIDEIGKFKNNGCYGFGDEKTTSSWDKVGYLQGFKNSSQLLFYRFALEWFAQQYPDSIFAKICKDKVAAFINGVFVSSNKETEFRRSDLIWFHQSQLDEFKTELNTIILKLVHYVKLRKRPPRQGLVNGACNSDKFGPCSFIGVCGHRSDEDMEAVLSMSFDKREYNPLTFGGGHKENDKSR